MQYINHKQIINSLSVCCLDFFFFLYILFIFYTVIHVLTNVFNSLHLFASQRIRALLMNAVSSPKSLIPLLEVREPKLPCSTSVISLECYTTMYSKVFIHQVCFLPGQLSCSIRNTKMFLHSS